MASPALRHTLPSVATLMLSLACAAGDPNDPGLGDDSMNGGGTTSQGGGANATAKAGGSGTAAGVSGGSGNLGGGAGGSPSGGRAGTNSTSSGGAGSTGGSSGAAAGGSSGQGSGGSAGGGMPAGGTSMGGASGRGAGGAPMAGMSGRGGNGPAGGAGSGGAGNAGGAGSGAGGAPTGEWTSGYVATMYGDISSGDCQPYSSNFTDHTPISTYTCVLGNGPRKVTLSSFSSGVANNASYYAALGDLSTLWQANGNASACSCNGSTTATCGGPSCPAEISSTGSCGLCIAVKCDPNSTFKDNNGYSHNMACNTTSYVVVQNIDACPHNHTTNVSSSAGWCTEKQSQHIDLSCSGLGDISNLGTKVGMQGWLPVSVQVVDCSVGLGKHSL